MNAVDVIAFVEDGRVRMTRPRKGKGKGREVFANFLAPEGADDDEVCRLVEELAGALAPKSEPEAEPAPAPVVEERRTKAPPITKAMVLAALRNANAVDRSTGLRPEALRRAVGSPDAGQLRKAITRFASEGAVVAEGRTQSRRIWLPADQVPRVEPDPNEGLPVTRFPPTYPPFAAQAAG